MKNFENSFKRLQKYCEKENFKGWDPYDGLNSWIIQKTFLRKSRLFRLAWIQLFKRNPINLRVMVGIKKQYNPKGLGLFLTGYCKQYQRKPDSETLEKIHQLSSELINLTTKGYSGACWGYNFDWQARAFFQPKYTPTVVATSFIVEALLEAYEIIENEELLETAKSAADFLLKDLNRTYDQNGNYTLSYSPLDKTQVFNAGLLGAKSLCLIYRYSRAPYLLESAKKIVSYVADKQANDGSWAYGTLRYHQWVDNFHTGYNLECIYIYKQVSGDTSFDENLSLGLKYYLETFFTTEGISKYYSDQTYPVDIHAPAQLVVTLQKMGELQNNKALIDRILTWTVDNMQSSKGYFYYQKRKGLSSKIPYIRWAQAWMFYAFSYYFFELGMDE
jgi:rhamnogalacturonyl hydrolase YesR